MRATRRLRHKGKIMKSLLLAATALTAFTVSALAADLPARKQAPVFNAAPAFTWTGFYIGGDVGGAWGRERDTLHIIEADSFPVSGAIGGAHIGYNWQMNQIVFGAEADVDASNVTGKAVAVGFPPGSSLSLKNNWRASLRLRAGYAIDTTLLYVTGGAAFAGVKSNLVVDVDPSWSHTLGGWTIGAGVEHAFTANWIGRVEARYSDFGQANNTATPPFGAFKVGLRDVQVLAGVSYKF